MAHVGTLPRLVIPNTEVTAPKVTKVIQNYVQLQLSRNCPTYWIVVSMVLGRVVLRAQSLDPPPKVHGFHNSSAFVSFRCSRVHDRCLRHHFLRAGLLIRGRTCQSMGRGRSQSGEAPSGLRPTEGDLDATLNLSSRILNKSSSSFQHAVTSLPWTRVDETPMGRQIKSSTCCVHCGSTIFARCPDANLNARVTLDKFPITSSNQFRQILVQEKSS